MAKLGRDYKGFWIRKEANKEFKKRCIDLEVNEQEIIEALVLRWLAMRGSKKQKRIANIYKDSNL